MVCFEVLLQIFCLNTKSKFESWVTFFSILVQISNKFRLQIKENIHRPLHVQSVVINYVWGCVCRYDYLFDPDEPDECKVPCLCKAPNCRKFMNQVFTFTHTTLHCFSARNANPLSSPSPKELIHSRLANSAFFFLFPLYNEPVFYLSFCSHNLSSFNKSYRLVSRHLCIY